MLPCRWWRAVWNDLTRTAATARSLPTPSSPSALTTANKDAARLVPPPSSRPTSDHRAGTAVQINRGARHIGAGIGRQEAHQVGIFLRRAHAADGNALADVGDVVFEGDGGLFSLVAVGHLI